MLALASTRARHPRARMCARISTRSRALTFMYISLDSFNIWVVMHAYLSSDRSADGEAAAMARKQCIRQLEQRVLEMEATSAGGVPEPEAA